MPDSRNRHAQSPDQCSCVQLKQYRQLPDNDGTWKLPPTLRADNQMRIKTRSETKKIRFCPVEMRNQLNWECY